MSITITTDVFCDGEDCAAWTPGTTGRRTDAKRARIEAKREGWKRIKGRDLCPACARAEKTDG